MTEVEFLADEIFREVSELVSIERSRIEHMDEEFVQVVGRIEGYRCRVHHDLEEDRPGRYPPGSDVKGCISKPVMVVHLFSGTDEGIGRPVTKTYGADALVDAPRLFAATVSEKLLVCLTVGVLHILVAVVDRVFRRHGLALWHR